MLKAKKAPFPLKRENGVVTWAHETGDKYLATGVTVYGKRFKISGDWPYIRCINVYRGTKWLVRDGRRYKIQTVFN